MFYKFPSTPHLTILSGVIVRDDKVLAVNEREVFLSHELIVEEKIDGANLGISFDGNGNLNVQNRGSYLMGPYTGQWKKLAEWLSCRLDLLFEALSDSFILFGEWCYAKHSVVYDRLPDWFLGFDVFDKREGRFLSLKRRNALLDYVRVSPVPQLATGVFSLEKLHQFFQTSLVGSEPAEGIYLRHDDKDWLEQRAKLVRPAFIQAVDEHWTSCQLMPNRLKMSAYD